QGFVCGLLPIVCTDPSIGPQCQPDLHVKVLGRPADDLALPLELGLLPVLLESRNRPSGLGLAYKDDPSWSSVELCFEAALDRIETAQRLPSPWEAECLLAALKAMATANWAVAQQKIYRSEGLPAAKSQGPQLHTTVEGLRSALRIVRELHEIRG